MKAGDKVRCPRCGDDTFAQEGVLLDGWTVKCKILKCGMCGEKLAELDKTEAPKAKEDDAGERGKLSAFASLLGTEELRKPEVMISQDVRRFCKDCAHFLNHPFHIRCALKDVEIDPMDDCENFTPRKKQE